MENILNHSFKKESDIKRPNIGRLVIHVINKEHKKNFITTYNRLIAEHNIISFLDSQKLTKSDIRKIYFKHIPYVW